MVTVIVTMMAMAMEDMVIAMMVAMVIAMMMAMVTVMQANTGDSLPSPSTINNSIC